MEHKGTAHLESERLILRPFVLGDAGAMFQNWASDCEVTKYLTWPTHNDKSSTEMVISDWVEKYADNTFYQWAMAIVSVGHGGIWG